MLKGLSGSFDVQSSQELGGTSWPLPVGWSAGGDLTSCSWEVTGRMWESRRESLCELP